MKRLIVLALAAGFLVSSLPAVSSAAMQIRKKAPAAESAPEPAAAEKAAEPAPERGKKDAAPAAAEKASGKADAAPAAASSSAPPPAPEKSSKDAFIGRVGFAEGKKAIIESALPLQAKQRLVAYDERLAKRGLVKILSQTGKSVYIGTVTAGSVKSGDRLIKETEDEAFARVFRSQSPAVVKEFLELYPESARKPEIALRLFRLTLRSEFPAKEGSRISGKLVLAEKVGQKIELGRALIKLDRFLIGITDQEGNFSIEGIPQLSMPVKVNFTVADPKFQAASEVSIEFPAEGLTSLNQNIEVKLTPTYLVGRVLDEKGQPLRGAQVWTSPYTMEKLTDENGEFRFWRKKKLDDAGNPVEGDEPVLGRDYEVYAYKQGYSAEKAVVSAQGFVENRVKPLELVKQNSVEDSLPQPQVGLRENLDLMQYVVSAGAGPKINR